MQPDPRPPPVGYQRRQPATYSRSANDDLLEAPLRFEVYEEALVVPSLSRAVYRNIDGAVFDSARQPIEASLLTRSWKAGRISYPPDISDLEFAKVERVETPHIYGGYFFDHFGHFLLESLARAWVVEEAGPMPFVWAAGDPPNAWQSEILSLLGLTMPHRFPRRPTLFRRLVIPTPGYRIQGSFHPCHARFLACYDATACADEGKVWLSRTEVDSRHRSRGEAALETALAARGWRILHPQRHLVAEQLRMMAGAGVLAGLEGSAFHGAVLLGSPAGPFVVLRRTPNRNYRAIAERKGITEFDLYGAFRLRDRTDLSLIHPEHSARMLEDLAQGIAHCRGDPARLAALRAEIEARHDFESWRRRQRWRWIAHARAFSKRNPGRRLRTALRRRLP